MKILCIGNSIVNGFPYNREQSFPHILSILTNYNVINKGINGQNTFQILNRFTTDVINKSPDIVIIMTGSNDFIFENSPPKTPIINVKKMISIAKSNNIQVIICSPLLTDTKQASMCWMPELNINYDKVNRSLISFSKSLNELCKEENIPFIDTQMEYKSFAQYCDGVHPTASGYEFLATVIKKNMSILDGKDNYND